MQELVDEYIASTRHDYISKGMVPSTVSQLNKCIIRDQSQFFPTLIYVQVINI